MHGGAFPQHATRKGSTLTHNGCVSEFKEHVDELAALMREFHLAEAELQGEDWKVVFRRGRRAAPAADDGHGPLMLHDAPPVVEAPVVPDKPAGTPVNSPMNGIYFGTPSPNTPPFVREGDTVQAGQIVGLIEAMKVFNEITAPLSGTVRKILVESGQLVQPGEALMFIE